MSERERKVDMKNASEKFDIYYDSLTEADWFSSLHSAFDISDNNYHIIAKRGNNPPLIDKIAEYDKPDIILVHNNKPLLVIEITQEVPTGHNVGQRFARLVRAIELGIPTIYYFPFDAKKHGDYAGICNLNIRLLEAAQKILEIHKTPLLCVNWPTDINGEIIIDGTENDAIIEILASYVDSGFDKNCQGIVKHLAYMQAEYSRRLKNRPSYSKLPPSVSKEQTSEFIRKYELKNVPSSFATRPYTYIYRINMSPDKCKRQDPYTGTAFRYDYIACRTGVNISDKTSNIVLHFPKLTVDIWNKKNPNDRTTKSCNWYLTANMLLLKDGSIFIRG